MTNIWRGGGEVHTCGINQQPTTNHHNHHPRSKHTRFLGVRRLREPPRGGESDGYASSFGTNG